MKLPDMTAVVTPAYRDYKTENEARQAFLGGKDFYHHTPTFVQLGSIRNFKSGCIVQVRYNRKQEVTTVAVP